MATEAKRGEFGERLRALPALPGVYLFHDGDGSVLYVGKAASLRNRVSSYFGSTPNLVPKIRNMMRRVEDFEFIVTESEQEALILECNLIKERQPQYNARLKDDKSYPFIKIDVSEDFPQVYVTRKVPNDGSRYFGPFASASSVRRTLNLLKKLFPYRSCTKTITGDDARPCLDFYIHRCVGPCIGAVDRNQYAEIIDQVVLFLEGKTNRIVKSISRRMEEAADGLEFERAAVLRDQLRAIEKVNEGQKVLNLSSENLDVIALAPSESEAWVEVFFIRHGKLIGRDNFIMAGTQDDTPSDILTAFVQQFYDANPYVPPRILVQHPLDDPDPIAEWLRQKRGSRVRVYKPQRGQKRRLMEMVSENARQGLDHLEIRRASDSVKLHAGLSELQEALSLPEPPRRIECYDISNIQGTNAVGSMVVFEDGRSAPSQYRRFRIKTVEGVDDYAMMREMLTRRFKRLAESRNAAKAPEDGDGDAGGKSGDAGSWGIAPDLALIDGGKGHLGAALQVFLELGIDFVPLASLAKENEELFVPHVQEAITLPRDSQGLYLVQRARDEAHRFAITYHRQRRSRKGAESIIDQVPGIGPKRRRMLIRQFGSTKGFKEATVEQIAAAPGMTLKLAKRVKNYL